jgi:hypothetical protein
MPASCSRGQLTPAVEVGGGGKRTTALRAAIVTVTDETAVRLDHVTRHLTVAFEQVAAAAPDRRFEEGRVLRLAGLRHHLEQGLALLADRQRVVVGNDAGGALPTADLREGGVDVS